MIEAWILIGIVLGCVIVILFFKLGDNLDSLYGMVLQIIGLFMAIGITITTISYCFVIFEWHAAKYKSDVINREYKTKYTQEEIFYAHDVIDTIREIDRGRIKINGNILREEKENGR